VHATIREIVHTTIGGDHVRLRISNEYGDQPITVGGVHLARRVSGSSVDAATDKVITFAGKTSVVVRTGAAVLSDPVACDVPALGDLAVSIYLPDSARTTTRHALGVQTTYVSRAGDLTASATFAADTTLRSWIFLAEIDVTNSRATGAIVAIGNSITDGYASTPDSNRRWPDVLAARLIAAQSEPLKSVVNAGISGNRVLTFGAGPSAVSRFDRDVLLVPGATHVIMLEGINDISRGGAEAVTADDIIFGLRQLADRAHEHGLVIYGSTLTPFSTAPAANEAKRQAVNAWIRTGGAYDGVIDFDAITRDPAQPNRFLPAFDSGDHLHPSDAGYKAMGDAIDLKLFRAKPKRQ
jgi:lysophospholipase L1-like esterase